MGFKSRRTAALPELDLEPGVRARPLQFGDTAAVFDALEKNRMHLHQWLQFPARTTTLEDARSWIRRRPQLALERGVTLGIFEGDRIVGVVSLAVDRPSDDGAHIGYWIDEQRQGRGWITRTVQAVCDYAFQNAIERVQIEVDVENARSHRIPELLGFQREGIARSRMWLRDRYRDHVVYSLLAREWRGARRSHR